MSASEIIEALDEAAYRRRVAERLTDEFFERMLEDVKRLLPPSPSPMMYGPGKSAAITARKDAFRRMLRERILERLK